MVCYLPAKTGISSKSKDAHYAVKTALRARVSVCRLVVVLALSPNIRIHRIHGITCSQLRTTRLFKRLALLFSCERLSNRVRIRAMLSSLTNDYKRWYRSSHFAWNSCTVCVLLWFRHFVFAWQTFRPAKLVSVESCVIYGKCTKYVIRCNCFFWHVTSCHLAFVVFGDAT